MMYTILHIFFLILFIYLSICVSYLLILSIASFTYRRRTTDVPVSGYKRMAILITSYKEDKVIVNTVSSAVNHDYPSEYFRVFVAAHHLQPATIEALRRLQADITEVDFSKGSKARSLNFLLNKIDEKEFDIAVVLDGDNIMRPGFLSKINAAMQMPAIAAQGHRKAKNLNTSLAILDALSEEVNNSLFRRSPAALGLSASLIGSGMAFPFATLKKIYNKPGILDNPACDREVDFELLTEGLTVKYLSEADLLDEKVAVREVYENQRKRWIESQLMHIRLFFTDWRRVKIKTADFWHKLIINLIPPRLIMLSLLILLLLTALAGRLTALNLTGISLTAWAVLFILYITSLFIAIPAAFYNRNTFGALFYLPILLVTFLKAAFRVRGTSKNFVHTPKTFTGDSGNTESTQ